LKKQLEPQIYVKVAKDRFKRRLARRGKTYNRFISVSKAVLGYKIIEAPVKICLYSAHGKDNSTFLDTLIFFEKLSQAQDEHKILISFEQTTRIEAAAIITLYALIEDLLQQTSIKIRFSLSKMNPEVNSTLRVSYLQKLMTNKSDITYNFKTKLPLPVITGCSNQYVDSIVDYLIQSVYEGNMEPEKEWTISVAIQEAVNNVGLHAYPADDSGKKKWWILCQVIDKQLYLAIYDKGVGIPMTIVQRGFFSSRFRSNYPNAYSMYVKMLRSSGRAAALSSVVGGTKRLLSDSEAINLSMIPDSTRTSKSKHGQGSKSIKRLVEENVDGKLWIFSNSGLYVKSQGAEQDLVDLPMPISGTLVQWNINLV
tara:strand:+ start:50583 stop:51686 length:1104 start_codon:yes stop_codon:yes gene_type:complete